MHLEISKDWGLFYDKDIGWFPYCLEHETPEFLKKYCYCIIPEDIWNKCFFMDKLEKFK